MFGAVRELLIAREVLTFEFKSGEFGNSVDELVDVGHISGFFEELKKAVMKYGAKDRLNFAKVEGWIVRGNIPANLGEIPQIIRDPIRAEVVFETVERGVMGLYPQAFRRGSRNQLEHI